MSFFFFCYFSFFTIAASKRCVFFFTSFFFVVFRFPEAAAAVNRRLRQISQFIVALAISRKNEVSLVHFFAALCVTVNSRLSLTPFFFCHLRTHVYCKNSIMKRTNRPARGRLVSCLSAAHTHKKKKKQEKRLRLTPLKSEELPINSKRKTFFLSFKPAPQSKQCAESVLQLYSAYQAVRPPKWEEEKERKNVHTSVVGAIILELAWLYESVLMVRSLLRLTACVKKEKRRIGSKTFFFFQLYLPHFFIPLLHLFSFLCVVSSILLK